MTVEVFAQDVQRRQVSEPEGRLVARSEALQLRRERFARRAATVDDHTFALGASPVQLSRLATKIHRAVNHGYWSLTKTIQALEPGYSPPR